MKKGFNRIMRVLFSIAIGFFSASCQGTSDKKSDLIRISALLKNYDISLHEYKAKNGLFPKSIDSFNEYIKSEVAHGEEAFLHKNIQMEIVATDSVWVIVCATQNREEIVMFSTDREALIRMKK
jgi:hypothetical protein